jgi:tetrahydromethanopterin S-methyltransferase subunit G
MLFGIVIGLILVSVAYVLCTRTWKGVDSSD